MRRLALVLVLVVSRIAAAEDGRLAAEQLAQEAMRTKDVAKLVACGNAYLDLYNKDPARPDGDEVLYNGAVCFQQARSVSSAILTWQNLLRSYPRSKLAGKALIQTATAYLGIARFDEAAPRLEEYAKRYGGEKDARDALENAITLRTALGDRDKRVADTKLYVTMYGARAPKDAADAMFAVVGAYDTPADQVKALREYIKTYGAKGSREQLAQAYQRLGDALWRQSCPVIGVDGLCAKAAHDKAAHCSTTAVRLEPIARTAAAHKEALAAYDQAIKIVEEAALTDPAAVHAAAMARLARGDELLEQMLGKKLDPRRLEGWVTDETKAAEAGNRAYEQVLAMKDPLAAIAAAARIGQLTQQFAAALDASPLPAAVKDPKTYCEQLTAVAEPLEARAQAAFGVCVQKAVELGVFDEWTALCRRETHTTIAETQPDLVLAIPLAGDGSPGEKAWHAGRRDEAMQAWQDALHANGKLYGAHLDLAIADLEKLRAMMATDPARRALASEADFQARNALGVRYDVAPYVVLAMLAVEDKHLDVARALIDQAMLDNDKNALLWAARAVIAARRGEWTLAYQSAEGAVAADPKSEVALRTSGLIAARVGMFDVAKARLASVKERSYEVVLARAIAARGLGDKQAAELLYQQALELGPGRPEAPHDLDLLRAPSSTR